MEVDGDFEEAIQNMFLDENYERMDWKYKDYH
jgi:hypothetical protein